MANEGFYSIGDHILGYTERNVLVQWDINPDLRSDRLTHIETPYYVVFDARYGTFQEILYIYITRWVATEVDGPPGTERLVALQGVVCHTSDRQACFYLDTGFRWAIAQGLFTNTPLLLKYPKYYNWSYIPEVLTPEFQIWSFYELDTSDIGIKLVGSESGTVELHSGRDADKFEITKISDKIWKIRVTVDKKFQAGETITCYVSAHDVYGQFLKDGLW